MSGGLLKKRLKESEELKDEYLTEEEQQGRDKTIKELDKILDEVKNDFPLDESIWVPWAKSHMRNLPEGKNPNPFETDHAQMILWFLKWSGIEGNNQDEC